MLDYLINDQLDCLSEDDQLKKVFLDAELVIEFFELLIIELRAII